MVIKFQIQLIKPLSKLRAHVFKTRDRSIPDIQKWIQTDLIPALVYGGYGIQGIAQTDFYKFITSPRGLSELGIEASEPPNLLRAYATSGFKIKILNKGSIILQFGDYAKLRMATPHPADGTGNLHIDSWLEWVEGKEVDRGFVPRKELRGSSEKFVRLGAPLGGLMLPKGAYSSTGLWRFPSQLRDYETKWFNDNIQRIQSLITEKMLGIISTNLTN